MPASDGDVRTPSSCSDISSENNPTGAAAGDVLRDVQHERSTSPSTAAPRR
jgi:hypothetical protein